MKISAREQIFLFLLLLVALWVLMTRFVFLPSFETVRDNILTRSELEAERQTMQALIAENAAAAQRAEEARASAREESLLFFPTFTTESLSLWLYRFTQEASLRNSEVTIGGRAATNLSVHDSVSPEATIRLGDIVSQINGAAPTQTTASPAQAEQIYVNTVTVKAVCYYDSLLYFINLLQSSGRTLYISKISVGGAGANTALTAELTIEVYSAPKFYDDDFLNVVFDRPEGRARIL